MRAERLWGSEQPESQLPKDHWEPRKVLSDRPRARHSLQDTDGLGQYHLVPSRDDTSLLGVAPNKDEPFLQSGRMEGESHHDHPHRQLDRLSTKLHLETRHPYVERAAVLMKSAGFQISTVVVICLNAICLGLETDLPDSNLWGYLEFLFLVFFACELGLRMVVITPKDFFTCNTEQDPWWNIFDFVLVALGLLVAVIGVCFPEHHMSEGDATLFRVIRLFRILRILRVVRVFRFLKQLYLLAYGFFEGAMAVFWVAVLASSLMYCCSIVIVRVYGGLADKDEFIAEHFATVPGAMFTLFEIMSSPTLHAYKEVMYEYPVLVTFIIIYVVFGSFGINGLLTGVISESILDKNQARVDEQRLEREAKRRKIEQDSSELFDEMDEDCTGALTREEIVNYKGVIHNLCKANGVTFLSHDLDHMFEILDYNDNGVIDKSEFVNGILELCEEIRPMSIMELNSLVSRCIAKVGRTDIKVDTMVQSVESLAFAKRHEAEDAEVLAIKMRDLLESHQRSPVEQEQDADATSQLKECESIMHKMTDLVTELRLKATSEAQVTENLASQLQQLPPGVAKGRSRPRRKTRLDPSKFATAPCKEEDPPQSPLQPVHSRRRRKSQTFHFRSDPAEYHEPPGQPSAVQIHHDKPTEAPVAKVSFSERAGEASSHVILQTSPSPKHGIRRSTTSPDLFAFASNTSPARLSEAERKKLANVSGGLPPSQPSHLYQFSELPVHLSTATPLQTCQEEACKQLVQEAMRHLDASSEIQRTFESTKRQAVGEAVKDVSGLKNLESLQEMHH